MFACVCVCVSAPRLLITSDVMWCDIDPYDWLNKSYGFYMAAVVGIDSGSSDVSIYTRSGNQPNKSKLALYKPLLHYNSHLKQL